MKTTDTVKTGIQPFYIYSSMQLIIVYQPMSTFCLNIND